MSKYLHSYRSELVEALTFKDMEGMLKPTVHVDEFASKMGDDQDIIVLSFLIRNQSAARDLVNWFEKGYDWVLDADQSPGEISPGQYLVYVEMRRRSTAGRKVAEMLGDLETLTEFDSTAWTMTHRGRDLPFSEENFDKLVPRSPREYKVQQEQSLNEMRIAAGIEPHHTINKTPEIQTLQSAAGI